MRDERLCCASLASPGVSSSLPLLFIMIIIIVTTTGSVFYLVSVIELFLSSPQSLLFPPNSPHLG